MAYENQEDLMLQAAIRYYRDDLTQSDIAKELYISRTKVSRLLKEAKERGIVEIAISGEARRNTFLENLLLKNYALKDTIVVAGLPEDQEKQFHAVTRAAAGYVDSILERHSIVGISRGATIRAVVDSLEPGRKLPVKIVQLIGLMNNPSQNEEEMDLVRRFAAAYGGTYHNLFSPFVLDNETDRQVLKRVAAVDRTVELARDADIVLTSVGRYDPNNEDIFWNAYLGVKDKIQIQKQGAVGLFCGRLYDVEGRILSEDMQSKIFGLSLEEIVQKPRVVGVACGRQKTEAILGALRGKLLKTLITDEYTALNVLIRAGKLQ